MKQIPLELQKMEMLGRLATSVIHDLNNMLTVIQLNAALLEVGGIEEEEQAKLVGEINRACSCAAGLTRSVLKFSRKSDGKVARFELGKVLLDIEPLLGVLAAKKASLVSSFPSEEIWVEGSTVGFQQIILNLVTNAVDSESKGDVGLTLRRAERGDKKFVEIVVSDQGKGISPEDVESIFEAFYTTKEQGRGTGLGLYIVHRIVSEWGGTLELKSALGEGTTFRVLLPEAEPAESKAKETAESRAARFQATVLLLEDDPGISAIGKQILERQGARVFQAGSIAKARGIWDAHRDDIELLFTDIVLPGEISGEEFAQELLGQKPGLKVLYTSGNESAAHHLLAVTHGPFLSKPYRPETLIDAVAKLLG